MPDWKETPLRKNKNIRDLVLRRGTLSNEIKERSSEVKELNLKLFTALMTAKVTRAKVEDFTVLIVEKEDQYKLDEGEFTRLLVEEAGIGIEVLMKLKKKASKIGKGTSYVMVTGGPDEDA